MSSALYNRCCASFLTLSRTIGGFRGGAARDACHQCSSSHSRFFVVFFVVVEPVSLIPLCTGLTAGGRSSRSWGSAWRRSAYLAACCCFCSRSEERRVGEEGRFRGGPDHLKKKNKSDCVVLG